MDLRELFIVVVLYKSRLEESRAIKSLGDCIDGSVNLMVFDNSPSKQYENHNFKLGKFNISYYSDEGNPGLSRAYNLALQLAGEAGLPWLLLLDQDTAFTKEYVREIESLSHGELPGSVVGIIPHVISLQNHKIIAPTKPSLGGLVNAVNLPSGIVNQQITSINSGTILRVSYMNSINGFCQKYTLDMLDHWYFRKIFQDKKNIYMLGSSIYQDLSVVGDFEANVSFLRYQKMLDAEHNFILEEGLLSLLVFKIRIFLRALKQLRYKNNQYYKSTFKQFFKLV
jgi:GT2 family glycosyltransferase